MSRLVIAAAALLAVAMPAAGHPSRGIVAAPDGAVYFSDLVRIWKLEGARLTLIRQNPGTHTHALAVDPAGRIVWEESDYDPATDRYRESIWRLTGNRLSRRYGPLSPPLRGLGITADKVGCTYHADQVRRGGPAIVHRWCIGGGSLLLFGSEADNRAFRPVLVNDVAGTALGADGRFYFRHHHTVRAIDRRGRVHLVTNTIADENFGIALDPSGALLVVENANRRLIRVANGIKHVVATTPKGWGPTGVAARGKSLYMLEARDYQRGQPIRMRVREVGRDVDRVLAQVTVPQP